MGDPPPPGIASPESTSPAGMKKLVPACRSIRSIIDAAVNEGKARRPRIEAKSIDQVNSGSSIMRRPGRRIARIVARKLSPPRVKLTMKRAMATSHRSCPRLDPAIAPLRAESGGYEVQPEAAGPDGVKNDASITTEETA